MSLRTAGGGEAIFLFGLLLLLTACAAPAVVAAPAASPAPTATFFAPMAPTATSAPPTLWLSPAVPDKLRVATKGFGLALVDSAEKASVRLDTASVPGPSASVWIYALVAAFPTVRDGATLEELKAAWAGQGPGLVMTEATASALKTVFGGDAGPGVEIVPASALTEALWQKRDRWGLVPFEQLSPRLKVLELDGQSPVRKDFNGEVYPLKVTFALQGAALTLPATNRDPAKLTTVVMTGTTALVRAISYKMQKMGIDYPASDIGGWLREADIAHLSNEVSFTSDCPPPDPNDITHLRFCSAAENIGLLENVGVDVVEVTGNHVNDWSREALLGTLELYHQRGWAYFGGGVNAAEARQPAVLERNGTKFAFIGCNVPGPEIAWATENNPGAADCGDYVWLVDEIKRLKAEGNVVIVTLQYYEFYSPEARPQQVVDFQRLAEAGADVVSGSQAHYSQAFAFYHDTLIHYGLGNLFFDQMGYTYNNGTRTTNTRREFIDRHVFYEGKLVSTELLTAWLEFYSKPRPMTPAEREQFLQEYFTASGW
jgi:poly-gamma-glutamate synthesis protein (capsule biosynthesis protein)